MGLSEFLRKTFADQRSRANEAGQAIVEYILVLIITVSIILGVMYQFNDAFKQFMDSWFGDYITCLMETGELPALGGAASGLCVSPQFNLAAGETGPGGDNSSGSSSSGSSNSNSESESESGSGSGSDSNNNDSSSGLDGGSSSRSKGLRPSRFNTSGGASNGEASTLNNRSSNRSGRFSQKIENSNQQKKEKIAGGSETDDSTTGGGRRGRTLRRRRIVYTGYDDLNDKKRKEDAPPVVAQGKMAKDEGGVSTLREQRFGLELPKSRKPTNEDMKSGFSFEVFIKFLMIAGIILAIVIFLGGQAVQIKKSWQKSE